MATCVHALVSIIHLLAGAAWFGSMFYSLTVLQPRAKTFFATDIEFEEFIATIASGARWKVLGAFAIVLLSGLALLPYSRPHSSLWWALIASKAVIYLVALIVFCNASWRLWPRRIFATPEEIPATQRAFQRVGITLIVLVAVEMTLGVIAHLL